MFGEGDAGGGSSDPEGADHLGAGSLIDALDSMFGGALSGMHNSGVDSFGGLAATGAGGSGWGASPGDIGMGLGQSPGAMGGPAGPGPGAGLGGGSGQSPGAMGGPAGGMGGGPGGGGPGGPSGGMGGMGGLGFEMGGYTGAGRDMMVQPAIARPAATHEGEFVFSGSGGGENRHVEARQAAQGREGR